MLHWLSMAITQESMVLPLFLLGVLGSWLGYPIVDHIVGLGITVTIIFIVKDLVKTIFSILIDGTEPATIDLIAGSTGDVKGVIEVSEVKARWFWHEIKAHLSIHHSNIPQECT